MIQTKASKPQQRSSSQPNHPMRPMPPSDSVAELSLRHLPDLSDASFSFQLPATATADFLLADDSTDFFQGGADNSSTSVTPVKNIHEALTLSQLTPRPNAKAKTASAPHGRPAPPTASSNDQTSVRSTAAKIAAGSSAVQAAREKAGCTPRRTATRGSKPKQASQEPSALGEGSSTGARLETLKAQVGALGDDDDNLRGDAPVSPTRSSQPRLQGARQLLDRSRKGALLKSKRVVSGGISKIRRKSGKLTASRLNIQPQRFLSSFTREPADSTAEDSQDSPDTTIDSTVDGGVAERLVMYSQKLMSSFGLSHSEIASECDSKQSSNVVGADAPLTISQLSPRKPSPAIPPYETNTSTSPMRTSSKRPASPEPDSPKRKKGKTMEEVGSKAPTVRTAARKQLGSSSSSSLRVQREARTAKRRLPVTHLRDDASGSSSLVDRQTHETESLKSSGGASSSSSAARVRDLANATKPVGFNFQLEARMEARKAEQEKERMLALQKVKKVGQPSVVPDFKTLHAAQEAELAVRRENIVPVVPFRVELSTDGRAKEREKFDEKVRAKERELERAREERRRERVAAEEREMREMRRKAVPRAHEVPEWYRERRGRVD